jgi:hypothetical protein
MCICEMGIIKKNGNILKKTKKNKKKGPTIPVWDEFDKVDIRITPTRVDNVYKTRRKRNNNESIQTGRMLMGSSHLSRWCLEEEKVRIRNGTNTSLYIPPFTLPTRKQPSIVVNVVFVIALFFSPYLFFRSLSQVTLFFLLLCFLLWAYFPFRSVSFYFFRPAISSFPIYFHVCQRWLSFVCVAMQVPSSHVQDRKRLSNWLGFPPQLHICWRGKGPWVIVVLVLVLVDDEEAK